MAVLNTVDPAYAAATITVINNDGAGEGFNDPSAPDPDSTVGGNTGKTLGAQRLIAFQHAADIWGGLIDSPIEIKVDATLDPLDCDATSATLGQAGPNTVHRDFTGAPVSATWYVQALANALAGNDLASADNDISAQFNSSIGTTCPFPNVWYYGLDASPPGAKADFVTIVLHELGHGLGFLSLVDLATGAKFLGFADAYMRFLEDHSTGKLYPAMADAERVAASTNTGNLHWTGSEVIAAGTILTSGRHPTGHVEMYAPDPQEPGSSVSHFSTSLSPNQLMEPFYTGPDHDPELGLCLLADLGWPIVGVCAAGAGTDLFITKTDSPDPVSVGDNMTYTLTLTVTNKGPDAASGVTVTDTLPASVTFVSVTPSQGSCSGTSTVTCTLGALVNTASATVDIVVTPNTAGSISNTVSVSADQSDPTPGDNSDTEPTTVNG